jgi:hypothetical protein
MRRCWLDMKPLWRVRTASVGSLASLASSLGQRLGGRCPQDPQLEAERPSRDLELFVARGGGRSPRREDRHAGDAWRDLAQQLQLLAVELRVAFDGPREVAAGPVEALDEPRADRVHSGGQDDGERDCGVPHRPRPTLADRDNEVEVQREQLGNVFGQLLGLARVRPPLDEDRLPLHVAKLGQAPAERRIEVRAWTTKRQTADAGNLRPGRRGLHLRRQRSAPGEQGEPGHAQAGPQESTAGVVGGA